MTKQIQMKNEKTVYDLEERTLRFTSRCIDVCNSLDKTTVNSKLVGQLVRSAGSIGANYREANDSVTRREFYHIIGICRREAKETRYWLQLLLHANQAESNEIVTLIDEAYQLTKIFSAIVLRQPKF